MTAKKNSKISVKESFVRAIEGQILSGELSVGDKLPPAHKLCELMGVSLTVVNAGISELASKGFVEVKPRRGTYVADYQANGTVETFLATLRYNGGQLSDHEIRSFCEGRIALDPYVAELVIKRASDAELDELGEIVERLRQQTDPDDFCAVIMEFFRKLYYLTDNTFFALLFNSCVLPQRQVYEYFISKNGTSHILKTAELSYEYLRQRDVAKARLCLASGMERTILGDTAIVPPEVESHAK